MSAYLKRLNISEVDDTGEIIGAYIKRVHIVEVVDSNGNPWEPVTEIGTVAISPDSALVAVMGSQTFTVVVTGGDATDLTYKWNVRSGSAQINTPDNQATATYTFIGAGQTQIQCTVYSANSSNSPVSNLAMVIVS